MSSSIVTKNNIPEVASFAMYEQMAIGQPCRSNLLAWVDLQRCCNHDAWGVYSTLQREPQLPGEVVPHTFISLIRNKWYYLAIFFCTVPKLLIQRSPSQAGFHPSYNSIVKTYLNASKVKFQLVNHCRNRYVAAKWTDEFIRSHWFASQPKSVDHIEWYYH